MRDASLSLDSPLHFLDDYSGVISFDGMIPEVNAVRSLEHDGIFYHESSTKYNSNIPHDSNSGHNIGAIREGGQINVWTSEYLGLLSTYACVGLIYGALPQTVYPFLRNYLHLDGFQANAAETLINLPWSFKALAGIASDSFPIFGYRRKSYIILGWLLCVSMLFVLAVLPTVEPYYAPNSKRIQNAKAPSQAAWYILFMMGASTGYLIADVAADGMTVELAQREPLLVRGSLQTTVYTVRMSFSAIAALFTGLTMNSPEYNGDFSWSISFNSLMWIIIGSCVIPIIMTIKCLHEEKVQIECFRKRCVLLWQLLQQRAIYQLIIFEFLYNFTSTFTISSYFNIERIWLDVVPFNRSLAAVCVQILFAGSLYLCKTYWLHVSWRKGLVLCTISIAIINGGYTLITIFNVYRNQWFWLFAPVLRTIPSAMQFLITIFPIVEVSPIGFEGTTYGLITTVINLAQPFSVAVANSIGSAFNAYSDEMETDTPNVQFDVALTVIIALCMNITSLLFLILLPKQKEDAQLLLKFGTPSRIVGLCTLIGLIIIILYSVAVNILSVISSTACLTIAGGRGC